MSRYISILNDNLGGSLPESNTIDAFVQKAGLDAANLRALLAQTKGETIQAPKLKGNFYERLELLDTHADEILSRLDAGVAPAFQFQISTSSAGGGTRPATANHATRSGGANHNTLVSQPGGKLSMTEQVLAAKGCKTLTEANEKFAKQSALGRCDD